MAEREGFEPPIPFRVYRFSRPTVSTAHTPLRVSVVNSLAGDDRPLVSGAWEGPDTPRPWVWLGLRPRLRGFNLCRILKFQLLDGNFSHAKLLDLAGHGEGKTIHELDVFGHLISSDPAGAKFLDVLGGQAGILFQLDPGHHLLAILEIRHAHYLDVTDSRTGEEKLLDLARVDVLATADDHILGATGDFHIPMGIHGGQVAGMQPAILGDGGAGGL